MPRAPCSRKQPGRRMHASYHTYVRKRKDGEKQERCCILLRLEIRQILSEPAVAACKWSVCFFVRQISISSFVFKTQRALDMLDDLMMAFATSVCLLALSRADRHEGILRIYVPGTYFVPLRRADCDVLCCVLCLRQMLNDNMLRALGAGCAIFCDYRVNEAGPKINVYGPRINYTYENKAHENKTHGNNGKKNRGGKSAKKVRKKNSKKSSKKHRSTSKKSGKYYSSIKQKKRGTWRGNRKKTKTTGEHSSKRKKKDKIKE